MTSNTYSTSDAILASRMLSKYAHSIRLIKFCDMKSHAIFFSNEVAIACRKFICIAHIRWTWFTLRYDTRTPLAPMSNLKGFGEETTSISIPFSFLWLNCFLYHDMFCVIHVTLQVFHRFTHLLKWKSLLNLKKKKLAGNFDLISSKIISIIGCHWYWLHAELLL